MKIRFFRSVLYTKSASDVMEETPQPLFGRRMISQPRPSLAGLADRHSRPNSDMLHSADRGSST